MTKETDFNRLQEMAKIQGEVFGRAGREIAEAFKCLAKAGTEKTE